LDSFHLLSVVNNAALSIGWKYLSSKMLALNSFGYIFRAELLDHMVILCLIFFGGWV
jgi:hypothetical protein